MAQPIADTYDSIPELMRAARGAYKRAVDLRLAEGGLEDLPTSSGFLLGYLDDGEDALPEKIEDLGFKPPQLRQLVDTLVLRGFITRTIDPRSGKESLALTERGQAANEASFEGCNYVDGELESRLSPVELAGLRRGLAVLAEIKRSLPGPVLRRGLRDSD